MATFARELRSESEDDVLGFLHALMMQINEHMTFDEDPTNSGTSAVEAFGLKRGVCQDYAHIFIACARSGGVPARFVAGHFLRSDGMVHQQAGHAWAEAFVPDLGWVGFDPANGICTTDAHARVAIGLDYLGAAPVRGTRYGGGMETLTVAVKVEQAGGRQGQSQKPVAEAAKTVHACGLAVLQPSNTWTLSGYGVWPGQSAIAFPESSRARHRATFQYSQLR